MSERFSIWKIRVATVLNLHVRKVKLDRAGGTTVNDFCVDPATAVVLYSLITGCGRIIPLKSVQQRDLLYSCFPKPLNVWKRYPAEYSFTLPPERKHSTQVSKTLRLLHKSRVLGRLSSL